MKLISVQDQRELNRRAITGAAENIASRQNADFLIK